MDVHNSLIRSLSISKYLTRSQWLRINEVQLYIFVQIYICNLEGAWLEDISEALTEAWGEE